MKRNIFLAIATILVAASPSMAGWHWVWDGTCDPFCTPTADGSWAWREQTEGRVYVPGVTIGSSTEAFYYEIVDNGSGGKALHLVDNSWQGCGEENYFKWFPFCTDRGTQACGVQAIESDRPEATGGTLVMRFKVKAYTPRTNETKSKQFIDLGYAYTASAGDRRGTKFSFWGDMTAVGGVNQPNDWRLRRGYDGIKWNGTNWVSSSGPQYTNPNTGTKNFCDDQWHVFWVKCSDTGPQIPDPISNPGLSHYEIWIDGILVDDYWSGGWTTATGKMGWETNADAIEAYLDYCAFSYQSYGWNELAIPSDTTPKPSSNNIGTARTFGDTYLAGIDAGDGKGVCMRFKYVTAEWKLPGFEADPGTNGTVMSGFSPGGNSWRAYWIEQDTKSAGIVALRCGGVEADPSGNPVDIEPGDRVDVYGALFTPWCTKHIAAWKMVKVDPGTYTSAITEDKVLCLNQRAVEWGWNKTIGYPFNPLPNSGAGLDPFGLYVTVTGKVILSKEDRNYLYIDDGSSFKSGAVDISNEPAKEIVGIKVWYPSDDVLPDGIIYVGDKISVRGAIGVSSYKCTSPIVTPFQIPMPTIYADQINLTR